jgi:hypothetical protein
MFLGYFGCNLSLDLGPPFYQFFFLTNGVFGCVERKWKERKLRKSMDEFGLTLNPSSFICFRNFLFFHFLSFKPNKA